MYTHTHTHTYIFLRKPSFFLTLKIIILSRENNMKENGLGLTQNSEYLNSNLVPKSGEKNVYPSGIMLLKQMNSIMHVKLISWPFMVILPIEKSFTHLLMARRQTFAHSLHTLVLLTVIFHWWQENHGIYIAMVGFWQVLYKLNSWFYLCSFVLEENQLRLINDVGDIFEVTYNDCIR